MAETSWRGTGRGKTGRSEEGRHARVGEARDETGRGKVGRSTAGHDGNIHECGGSWNDWNGLEQGVAFHSGGMW